MPYPGSNFTTIGGKLEAFQTGPTTERLLIIGTAQDGPLNKPISIPDAATAERIFGPVTYINGYNDPFDGTASAKFSAASIPLAVSQALAAGAADIWVVRATGSYATSPSAFTSKLNLKAVNPGYIYNTVSLGLQVSGSILSATLTQPPTKGITFTSTFASSLTVAEFIDTINGDRRNSCLTIVRDTYASILASACTSLGTSALVTVTLVGGTNGTSAKGDDYATSFDGFANLLVTTDSGTFDSLAGQKFGFDVAVLTGIHLDNQVATSGSAKPNGGGNWAAADEYSNSIATDFVIWLDQMSNEVRPCFGVIGLRPTGLRDDSSVITYINNSLLASGAGFYDSTQRWLKAGFFLFTGWNRTDPLAGNVDLGQRLAVVAGPDVVYTHPAIGNYSSQWHASYAGILSTMAPERAPIFKPVPGITGYGTAFPAKYCNKLVEGVGYDSVNDLSGLGAYVCLTRNPRNPLGPMVIFDDVTAAARNDYMRNHQLVHLCNSIHRTLDNGLSGFLGGPTSAAALAAMETIIQNIMDGYTASNALKGGRGQGYDFQVTMSGTDQALGVVRVFVTISPATALRKFYFVVQVQQSN